MAGTPDRSGKIHVICIDPNVPSPHRQLARDEVYEVSAIRMHPVFPSINLAYLRDGPESGVGYLLRRFRQLP